jgi:hypothetical protein
VRPQRKALPENRLENRARRTRFSELVVQRGPIHGFSVRGRKSGGDGVTTEFAHYCTLSFKATQPWDHATFSLMVFGAICKKPQQRAAIAAAAKRLDELRSNWLNPSEMVRTEILEFPGSLDGPWSGYVFLERAGERVNRKRVQRLMAVMGLEAVHPRPRTTTAAPEARAYPYLLRDRVLTHADEVWSSDIRRATRLYTRRMAAHAAWVPHCPAHGSGRPARGRTGSGWRKRSVRIELGHDNRDRGSASGQAAAQWELIAAADVEGDLPHSGAILRTAQIAAEICSQGMPRGNSGPRGERIRGVWCTPGPIDQTY